MSQAKLDRIENISEEIKNLKKRQQQLRNQHKAQERKARTKRLIERGAELESMLPDTVIFTKEQFRIFLKRTTANDFGRKILAEMVVKNAETLAEEQSNSPTPDGDAATPEPADAVRGDGTEGNADSGGARSGS